MRYIKIDSVDAFQNRTIKSFMIFGIRIAVIKRDDGAFDAIEAGCKHQSADLTMGTVRDGVVTCPRHGWKYNLETGECLNRLSPKLKKYDLKIEDGDILISTKPLSE